MENTKYPVFCIDKKRRLFYVKDYTRRRSVNCIETVQKNNIYLISRL